MEATHDLEPSGFFRRLFALLLDGMIMLPLTVGLLYGLAMSTGMSISEFAQDPSPIYNVLMFGVNAAYHIYFIHKGGQTLGKKVLKIKVVNAKDPQGQIPVLKIVLRESIGRFISGAVFMLGYFLAAFGGKNLKRSLHDYLADTRVIKV